MKTTTIVLIRLVLSVPAIILGFCWLVSCGENSMFLNQVLNIFSISSGVMMYVAIFSMFSLFLLAAFIFSLLPLWRKKLPKNDGTTRIVHLIIAVSVSSALLYLPTRAIAQQQVVEKTMVVERPGQVVTTDETALTAEEQQAVDAAVNAAMAMFPAGFSQDDNGYKYETKINLITCVVIIVIVVLIICGSVYIYYKVKKFCNKIFPRVREKQGEDERTNAAPLSIKFNLAGEGVTEYAASFNTGVYLFLNSEQVATNCECYSCGSAPVLIQYTVNQESAAKGGLIPITISSSQSVYEDDYLVRHGLGTNNLLTSLAANRQPTNTLDEILLNENGITVMPGATNLVTTEIYWSTNLAYWEILPMSRLTVPLSGTNAVHVTLEDGVTADNLPVKFYRVLVAK